MNFLVLPKNLREQLRRQKNTAIRAYFRQRIYSSSEPGKIWGRSQPMRILLILSHMRSGSSLLTHILTDNPAILGYGETHITYQTPQDFKQLMAEVYWQCHDFRQLRDLTHLRMNHQYVLDKVLHNHLLADPALLTHPQVSIIFLIREPAPSLVSLQKLKPHLSDRQRFYYYKNRLIQLENYAEFVKNKERSLWVTYEQLLHQTPSVLSHLKQFLSTDSGFSEQYQLLKTTGKKGVGDSQAKIKSGKIIRPSTPSLASLPPDISKDAEAVYQNTYQKLSNYCTATVPWRG
ncbi:MAG: sulfotransferase [Phormidium sp.]